MKQSMVARVLVGAVILPAAAGLLAPTQARAQERTAREVLESAAEAMGGLERLRSLDNVVYTGWGQYVYQSGGGFVTGDPNAPPKWQAAHDAQRSVDLRNRRALLQDRRSLLFPLASPVGHSWNRSSTLQTGAAMLDHPLPAVLAALDASTTLGPVRAEDGLEVVEFTIADGNTLWIGIDGVTHLPYWVRSIGPSATLGDLATTTYFTGYLPYDDVWLPVGLMSRFDWRDTIAMMFQVDAYRVNVDDLPAFPEPRAGGGPRGGGPPAITVTEVADGVWDLRTAGGNGGPVMEFEDRLVMFEAYGGEAETLARIDAANGLVPGKAVAAVIVSHHHFDHSGGLRAAVSRGLTVISHRGNRGIFEEMVARPAPNYPDALARNPRRLDFVPVDERLVLEDGTMRVEVLHAVGHAHMANAVVAWLPAQRIFVEGDFTTWNWDWHWWGGALLDTAERYGLDPETNIPVHGRITSFEEAAATIDEQVERARAFCAANVEASVFFPGCPVQYSRDSR